MLVKLSKQADRYKALRKKSISYLNKLKSQDNKSITVELTEEELIDIAILCGNNETIIRRKLRNMK